MFDILVYLYETYYRPETCPDSIVLAKKLSAVGFDDEEIVEALDWLSALANATKPQVHEVGLDETSIEIPLNAGFRVFTEHESSCLGVTAIGFLHYLENANLLNMQQREVVIERAMALDDAPVALDKLKVVVLMVLWSQGAELDILKFDDLLLSNHESEPRLLH
jgi:Smg protein